MAAADGWEPLPEVSKAKIMGMSFTIDGEEELTLKPTDCYRLPLERFQLYQPVLEAGTAPENVVAVTCSVEGRGDGAVVETLVDEASGEHLVMMDPIMYTEVAIPSLVEAQFVQGAPWTLSRGTADGIAREKEVLFAKYAETIRQDPPGCLATLRRLLQAAPITTVYSGGGNGRSVPSHEGFALRMPPAEVAAWTTTNDRGEVVDIPRPAFALRVWDAATRAYAHIDPLLNGAPRGEVETEAWFCGVVAKLKGSPTWGSELLDRFATSERTVSSEHPLQFEGTCRNRWTDLVLATQPALPP
jgi:hypothetical protein